jgi:23S rRNA pseudouridine2605 synthase
VGEMRLQKFLARAGVASRRKAEKMITNGIVEINDVVVRELGTKVSLNDEVKVKGRIVSIKRQNIYIMLNKPTGYITSVKDQFSRKTVMDLITDIEDRVYPVGRLDYDTSGLLLLTNDGDLTYKITHPKHEIEKIYIAEVEGFVEQKDIMAFSRGINIDGTLTAPATLEVIELKKDSSIVNNYCNNSTNH